MYCKNCKEYFDTPVEKDSGGITHDGKYYPCECDCCPKCNSRNIQESGRCRLCGEATPRAIDEYCGACLDIADKYINDLAEYMDTDRKQAIALLSEIIERER